MIDIILQKRCFFGQTERVQCPVQNDITSPVKSHNIPQPHTLRRRILQMPHIDINPPRIKQKTPIARGFIPTAIVNIHNPDSFNVKNVILYLHRNSIGTHKTFALGCQTPILGFQTKNSISHGSLPLIGARHASPLQYKLCQSGRNFFCIEIAIFVFSQLRPPEHHRLHL